MNTAKETFVFPEPMYEVHDLYEKKYSPNKYKYDEEPVVYESIEVETRYIYDEQLAEMFGGDGKTYLRGSDLYTLGCSRMNRDFIPVRFVENSNELVEWVLQNHFNVILNDKG